MISVAAASCSGACLAGWEVAVATTYEAVRPWRAILVETRAWSCAMIAVLATAAATQRAPNCPSNSAAIDALAGVVGVDQVVWFAGKQTAVVIGC